MSSGTGSNYPAPVVAGESAGINQAFQPFPYPGTTTAANAALSGIQNEVNPATTSALTNAGLGAIQAGQALPGQLAPIAQQGLQGGTNIYNTLTSQAGAPIAAGNQVYAQGQQQYGMLSPYVSQALQAGFDPQNALYNQQYNLQQQQQQASNAQSGVGQSPYAAGLTAQGDQNFNINWQNQQLARQAQAAQTAEGLSSTAMGDAATGANALNAGYNTATGMDTAAINALLGGISSYDTTTGLGISGLEGLLGTGGNAIAQATGLDANQVSQYLAYLQGSTNAGSAATGAQLNALNVGNNIYGTTNQGNLAQQQLLTQSLGGLGSLGGTLGGAYMNSSALNNIAAAL